MVRFDSGARFPENVFISLHLSFLIFEIVTMIIIAWFIGFIQIKGGADRGVSKCLSAVESHIVFRKIITTNLGKKSL